MKPKKELPNSETPAKSPSRPSKESTAKPKAREKEQPSGSSRSTSRHSVKEDGAKPDEKKKLSKEVTAPKPKGSKEGEKEGSSRPTIQNLSKESATKPNEKKKNSKEITIPKPKGSKEGEKEGSARATTKGAAKESASKPDEKKKFFKELLIPKKGSKEGESSSSGGHRGSSEESKKCSKESVSPPPVVPSSPPTKGKVNKTTENSDRLQVSDTPAERKVHKVVLTGGPCGGKTTGQSRLAAFFRKHGWTVFCVPEAATILLGGGVQFAELNASQAKRFQKDLLLTLLQLEKVYFKQAKLISDKNVLIICDRGAMDPSAFVTVPQWQEILKECKLKACDLREGRYNQIVHMVTAADGAKEYYSLATNCTRSENINQAIECDRRARNVWIGHPYIDIIENTDCINFEDKIRKMIGAVATRVGIDSDASICKNSRKRKWLVASIDESTFAPFEKFHIIIDYLLTENPDIQVRLRRRCQTPDYATYTITTRHYGIPEPFETRAEISLKQYQRHLTMKDSTRATLHKTRRCFLHNAQYFQLDTYEEPLPPGAKGQPLKILEAYTMKAVGDSLPELPKFIEIVREITKEEGYSMFMLAKVDSVRERKSALEPVTARGAIAE